MYYTYILFCTDQATNRRKIYIGSTADLKERIATHRSKSVQTTKSFDTMELVYYEACKNKKDARSRELQLKTGFGRGYIKKRLKNYFQEAGIV